MRHVDKADQDGSLLYYTSKLHWEECVVTVLPRFELYAVKDDIPFGMVVKSETAPIAKVSRPLWNSCRSTLAMMKTFKVDECLQIDHRLPSDIRKTWRLH